nr:hypothetical protein [Tanacetum cinerariifolium]
MDVAVDKLSSLLDDLIHKILSFVDIAYSIRLSVLSSRWRFIWTSMPNLSFATNEVSRSSPNHEFVNNVISGRNNQIDISSVHLMFDAKATEVFVKRILEYAFSHNVQQMTIQMITISEFPHSLLSSKSLKHLTMISTSIDCRSYSPWDLPALTTLHLQYVRLYSRSSILAMCQNLKNLALERCEVFEFESCNGFSIINSRLLNLTLKDVEWYVDFVYVDTPQLKSLIIVDAPKYCSISELSGELTISAQKVDLSISSPHKTDVHKICELLQRLHSVKSLALSLEIVELLSSSEEKPAAMEINLSNDVKSYLLDGSQNTTLTVLSHEVVTSKRVEMQQRYSRLCAEAETVVDKIIDDM